MENIGNYREKIQQKLITKFPGLSNWIYLTALAIYTLAMSLKGTMLVNFLITERGLFYLSAFPAVYAKSNKLIDQNVRRREKR